jgi:hypothetical protein
VQRQTLALLLRGLNPRTGQRIRRPGPDGTAVAALDLTLSPAPKSVSVLWALAPPQLRFELEAMVAMAADRAVMRMLREQPFVRKRVAPGPQGIRRVRQRTRWRSRPCTPRLG